MMSYLPPPPPSDPFVVRLFGAGFGDVYSQQFGGVPICSTNCSVPDLRLRDALELSNVVSEKTCSYCKSTSANIESKIRPGTCANCGAPLAAERPTADHHPVRIPQETIRALEFGAELIKKTERELEEAMNGAPL